MSWRSASFLALVGVFLVLRGSALRAGTPTARTDLNPVLERLLCADTAPLNPARSLAAGLVDANLQGMILRSKKAVTIDSLRRSARSLATRNMHGGHSFGQCSDGSYWIASMPSPVSLQRNAGRVEIPVDLLGSRCKKHEVTYVRWEAGDAQRLQLEGSNLSIKGLAPGIAAVTCHPTRPAWAGPTNWFLVPIGGVDIRSVPLWESTPRLQDPMAQLVSWINRIRSRQGRVALRHDREHLRDAASLLAASGRSSHDTSLMGKVLDQLLAESVTPLGENRVVGADLHEMVTLLWMSPRHRQLLLEERANLIGVVQRVVPTGKLAVLVVANKKRPKVSMNKKVK